MQKVSQGSWPVNKDLRKTAKLMFSPDQENHPSKAPVKYGELIVLG